MNKTTEHGEYYFSFFSTELKTEKSLDEVFPDGKMDLLSNSEISEDEKKSYVHEFVHFIQDITTIYGLKKLTVEYNKARYLYNSNSQEISFPYRFQNKEEIFMQYNINLFSLAHNETKSEKLPHFPCKVIIYEKDAKKEFVIDEEITGEYSYFKVELDYGSKKYGPYSFGGHCISECMARYIENHLFPPQPKAFDSDYDLPYIIAKNIYPKIFSNPKFVVALCDASLFFDFPGQVFIETLNYIKDNQLTYCKSYEIYSLVWSLYGNSKIVFNQWINTVNEAVNSIDVIVNVNEPEFEEPRDWAKQLIRTYCIERMKNTAFFTNLMEETQDNAKQYFMNIIYQFGSSLCYTKNYEFFLLDSVNIIPNPDLISYWWKLKRMFDLCFNSFDMGCPFACICPKGTSVCQETPWCKQNEFLCDYDQFARCFGLYKRKRINN